MSILNYYYFDHFKMYHIFILKKDNLFTRSRRRRITCRTGKFHLLPLVSFKIEQMRIVVELTVPQVVIIPTEHNQVLFQQGHAVTGSRRGPIRSSFFKVEKKNMKKNIFFKFFFKTKKLGYNLRYLVPDLGLQIHHMQIVVVIELGL